jgi:hypothetical protein
MLTLLSVFLIIPNGNLSYADNKENMAKNAEVYHWGDVLVDNTYIDRHYSVNEIKTISSYIKHKIYYQYNLKKFPVCIITYFTNRNKIPVTGDPWEVRGWEYQYVINRQMKQEFLYAVVGGKTKRIQ